MPSGPIETHGSDARSYESPPSVHMVNGRAVCEPHVVPPLNDAAAISACAPPFDQRSCCHTAIRFPAVAGFAATKGSTSVLLKAVPPAAGAAQAATGLGLLEMTDVNAATAAVAVASATIDPPASAVERMTLPMKPPFVLRAAS